VRKKTKFYDYFNKEGGEEEVSGSDEEEDDDNDDGEINFSNLPSCVTRIHVCFNYLY
jgi:hypothetical protein